MSKKLHLLSVLILVCSMNYLQNKFGSGYVEYGVDFNEGVLKKLDDEYKKDTYKKSVLNFVRRSFLNDKKIYSRDITFIKLNFRDNVYLLKTC